MDKKVNLRKVILRTLVGFYKNEQYSNISLDNAINSNSGELDRKDIAFITRIFYGVIEKQIYIDFILSDLIAKGIENVDEYVLNILRIGIYEIEFMNSIPDGATCFECVETVKQYNKNAVGFVNGVLRNFLRNKNNIHQKIEELHKKKKLSVVYSVPVRLIDLWEVQYGMDACEQLLAESSNRNGVCLTVNTLKVSVEEFLHNNQSIECERTKYSQKGIKFLHDMPIKKINGYDDGLFFVQDEASQICASEADAKEGDFVIDVCAAPGGKSFYMSLDMKNKGKILSFDLHENKIKTINKGAERLGIDIIQAQSHNSTVLKEELAGKADKVLCDVPCSGLGVINKKPEIKYKNYGDFSSLCKTQYEILSVSSNYVKDNGTLIYSTCTLNKKENEDIIFKFLDENKNFKCVEFTNDVNKADNLSLGKGIKTFFPHIEKIDGFFLVKMIRFGV